MVMSPFYKPHFKYVFIIRMIRIIVKTLEIEKRTCNSWNDMILCGWGESNMDEINTSTIGERIRLLRKRNGMSQIELAAAIQKSTRTVQKYENGEIEVSQFVAHQ